MHRFHLVSFFGGKTLQLQTTKWVPIKLRGWLFISFYIYLVISIDAPKSWHFVQPIFDHYTHLDLCRRYFVVDPRNRMFVGNPTRNHNWIQPIYWGYNPLAQLIPVISYYFWYKIWLVASTPLKNISQLGWWHSQLKGKIKFMFQTTHQTYSWLCPVYPHYIPIVSAFIDGQIPRRFRNSNMIFTFIS